MSTLAERIQEFERYLRTVPRPLSDDDRRALQALYDDLVRITRARP